MNTHTPLSIPSKASTILCVNFNQDQGCFAVGHENGFLVYNTNPIDLRVKRNFNHHHHHHSQTQSQTQNHSRSNSNNESNQPQSFPSPHNSSSSSNSGSGIGHITMLHRTNYLALVGGGKNPKFSNNKLIIWDDLKRKNSLSLEFMSPVLNVLLSRTRIIIVLKNQVLVYGFSAPPKKFATYETIDNELGLADLSVNSTMVSPTTLSTGDPITNDSSSTMSLNPSISSNGSNKDTNSSSTTHNNSNNSNNNNNNNSKYQTLAFPSRSIGQIQIVDVSPQGQEKNLVSIIKAHKSRIRCLALNRSGTLIASASETGTIIRVHSTHNTALLYEFRRGLDRAIITSIKFSHNDFKLAVLSDKNTLHIFNLSPPIHTSSVVSTNSISSTTTNSSLSLSMSNSSSNTITSSPASVLKNNGQPQSQQHHATTSTTTTNIYSNFQNKNNKINDSSLQEQSPPSQQQPQSQPRFYHIPVNRHHVLQKLPLPLPNYFKSTWSFCSINTNQYHNEFNNEVNHNDIGVLGWSGNDNVIIIWKNKKIWERYVIIEKYSSNSNGGQANAHIDDGSSSNGGDVAGGGHTSWEIVRSSWKYLDSLED